MTISVLFSVTRFGEISSIWQYAASLWAISKGLNQYLAKCYTIFCDFLLLGEFSLLENGPILKNNLAIWSHWFC